MDRSGNLSHWLIHGLGVSGEKRFSPHLSMQTSSTANPPDVQIEAHDVPSQLACVEQKSLLWQSNTEQFLIKVPRLGRIIAQQGKSIHIMAYDESCIGRLKPFLWQDVWFSLLMQRGMTPFNASVIAHNGKAVALLSSRSNGKSMLAEALLKKNFKLVCDQFCVIDNHNGQLRALPGFQHIVKWDTLLSSHIKNTGYVAHASELTDRQTMVPAPELRQLAPLPLCCAFDLRPNAGAKLSADKMNAMQTVQSWIKTGPERFYSSDRKTMQTICQCSSSIPMHQLSYDLYKHEAANIADLITEVIADVR